MKKALFVCLIAVFAAVHLRAEQTVIEPRWERAQGMMTDGGQMPIMKQMKLQEMMMQDIIRVMGDIVQMQHNLVAGMKIPGKKDMLLRLEDLSARVNTLSAGMKGMIAQAPTGQGAPGGYGPGGTVKRAPGINAPRIQEKTEAGVKVKVAMESSNAVLIFRVILSSTEENLSQYKFSESVLLRATGGRDFQPRVRSEEGRSYYRSAILEFDNPGTKQYEIVVRNIAGVPERIFSFPF